MTEADTSGGAVGERVRALRGQAGLTVRELARRVGVSPSHVSQVERGIGSFSAPTLDAIAGELGVQAQDLDVRTPLSSVAPQCEPGDSVLAGIVQRAGDHPSIKLGTGPRWSRLTATGEADAEFFEVSYAPGTAAPVEHIVHDGREYGVVIEGRLRMEVRGESTVLEPGDAIAFDAALPHRFWNEGEAPVRAIWFVRGRGIGGPVPHV